MWSVGEFVEKDYNIVLFISSFTELLMKDLFSSLKFCRTF